MKTLKFAVLGLLVLMVSACSKVNEENYLQLENGMTFDEVQSIIGKADLIESTSLAGISTTRAEWHGKDGTISIRFIETKVRAKNWQPPAKP